MKLIIDISNKMFDTFKKHGIMTFDSLDEYDKDILADTIANGTPLDEIRAEIEAQREEASNKHSEDRELQYYYYGLNDGLKDARDVLDEYNAESEADNEQT